MKSVLISIRPQWCEKIASGKKTIEVRKTAPKEVPFKCYIYMTQGAYKDLGLYSEGIYQNRMKVIGEFICDEVEEFHEWELSPQGKFADFERERLENFLTAACLSEEEVVRYRENLPYFKPLYGWHISDLKIYDKPKELREFYYCCKEMKANEPRAGKYVSLSCYACRHNALKRTEDYSEYNNMLGYICKRNITHPPQSYMFVEEVEEQNNNDN